MTDAASQILSFPRSLEQKQLDWNEENVAAKRAESNKDPRGSHFGGAEARVASVALCGVFFVPVCTAMFCGLGFFVAMLVPLWRASKLEAGNKEKNARFSFSVEQDCSQSL